MKKLFLFCVAAAMTLTATAQEQIEQQTTENFATYNRSSVSIVTIDYNDEWDEIFHPTVAGYTISQKFDINEINTKLIAVDSVVRTTPKDSTASPLDGTAYGPKVVEAEQDSSALGKFGNMLSGLAGALDLLMPAKPDKATELLITKHLNDNNIGKEVLSYILARDAEGKFSRTIIDQRSAWNATDEDVVADQFMQVARMGQDGNTLIKNSFITVYDMKNPTKTVTESTDKDGNKTTKISWSAVVSAYVYEIVDAEAVVNNVLGNMWINDDDDAATKEAKKAAYDELQVNVKLVASQAVKVTDEYLDRALATTYEKTLHKLEKKISAWQTTANCETVRPYITAKVGTKEGVKNTQRFAIYGQKWNKKTEESEYKRLGYARATVVADNNHIADGNMDSTYFYQIAGSRLKGDFTEIVKQSNDAKIGVSLTGNYNQMKFGSVSQGGFSLIDLTVDYLAYMHKNGISHYGLINVGWDIKTPGMLQKEGNNKTGATDAWIESHDLKAGLSFVNVAIGYQVGLKVKQVVEFQPFIKLGMDIAMPHGKALYNATYAGDKDLINAYYMATYWGEYWDVDVVSEKDAKATSAFYLDPGLRILINCGYPFQLFVQANYSLNVYQGAAYKAINTGLSAYGCGHNNGLSLGAGFKLNF